ncbi:hypothetical protein D3C79_934610 [compost metagenome]
MITSIGVVFFVTVSPSNTAIPSVKPLVPFNNKSAFMSPRPSPAELPVFLDTIHLPFAILVEPTPLISLFEFPPT